MIKKNLFNSTMGILEYTAKKIYEQDLVPEGLKIVENIYYINDGMDEHLLDIIYPRNKQEVYPFIINIHGGGFSMNSKDKIYRNYAMRLAENNFAVVNINFRLSKNAPYPAQIEDVLKILEFLEENHEKYSLDTGNVFFVGDSSGAYMAALIECILSNCILRDYYQSKVKISPKAVALNCGMYDFSTFLGKDILFPMRKDIVTQLFGRKDFENSESFEYTSIFKYITKDYCPVYIMDTQSFSFANEALRFIEKLKANNVEYHGHIFEKSERLRHVFNIFGKYPKSKVVMEETFDFFNKHMNKKP